MTEIQKEFNSGVSRIRRRTKSQTMRVGIGTLSVGLVLVGAIVTISGDRGGRDRSKVVCYYDSASDDRRGKGRFEINDIDPSLCTHLIYLRATIKDGKIHATDNSEDDRRGAYEKFNKLGDGGRSGVRTMISVGGPGRHAGEKISDVASTSENRRIFVDSVMRFLKKHDFQGLDVHWENSRRYGGINGDHRKFDDKKNFAKLIQELKENFDDESKDYILSAAISGKNDIVESSYNIQSISKNVDFLNVRTFDYYDSSERAARHHAAVGKHPKDRSDTEMYNVNDTIDYLLSEGAHRDKLVLGIPAYGRGYTLRERNENGPHAPTRDPIPAGPYTDEPGLWGYNEICDKLQSESNEWSVVEERHYKSPYAHSNRYWIGYDDPESAGLKANIAKEMRLGGVMLWAIDTDDFRGDCSRHNYPLLRKISRVMNHNGRPGHQNGGNRPDDVPNEQPMESSSTDVTMTTEMAMTTEMEMTTEMSMYPPSEICKKPGINPNPEDKCTTFYQCVQDDDTWIKYKMNCGPGTVFNPKLEVCDHPRQVRGCENQAATAAPEEPEPESSTTEEIQFKPA